MRFPLCVPRNLGKKPVQSRDQDRHRYLHDGRSRLTVSDDITQKSARSVTIPLFDESNNLGAESYIFQPDDHSVRFFVSHFIASNHVPNRQGSISIRLRSSCAW